MKKPNKKNDHPKWMGQLFATIHGCWQHHAPCKHINMQSYWDENSDCWQVKAAPVYQEVYGGDDDGKKVWAGFLFDMGEFSRSHGVWIQEQALCSVCVECTQHPKIMARGKFQGHPIFLEVYLEPVADTEPVEIIDTLKQEIREMPEPSEATEKNEPS